MRMEGRLFAGFQACIQDPYVVIFQDHFVVFRSRYDGI